MLLRRPASLALNLFLHHQSPKSWPLVNKLPRSCFSSLPAKSSNNLATPEPQLKVDPGVEAVFSSENEPHPDQTEFTIQLTDEEMERITGGDEELRKKVKYIQLEHEVYRQEGMNVPSIIKLPHWTELLSLPSPSTRRKYYNFLFLNEMKSINAKLKKQEKQKERLAKYAESDTGWAPKSENDDPNGLIYGLGRNTLFLRLYDTTINRTHHNKVTKAMQFGPQMVLDCGYDEHMNPREAKNCAKQIEIMLSQNRSHTEPFDLHLCNAPKEGRLMQMLLKINPALYDDTHPVNITDESYTQVFDRSKLVYLSPHAKDELESYSEDEIYIIGAMVDKTDGRPLSLAKAKREGIKLRKLPLDKHLVWGMGGKSLTINQVVAIMLDLRRTGGDWKVALDHVPKRKLNRDFHPYPGQEVNDDIEFRQPLQPMRREGRSRVVQDFEAMRGRGKGFGMGSSGGGFDRGGYSRDSSGRREGGFDRDARRKEGGFRVKSLFDD